MANAEIYSYTARLNDELRSSPKGKTEKIVPVMVKDSFGGWTNGYVYYLERTCKILMEIVTNFIST